MKLLLTVIALGGLLAGLAGALFGNHSYTVTAYFLSAEGLTQENDVVINGGRAGKVVSVGIAPDNGPSQGGAPVVMEIGAGSAPLHLGTRAASRSKGVLANPLSDLTARRPAG